jgi:uncharacterized secreted repeat protein (TIGR03808 family)
MLRGTLDAGELGLTPAANGQSHGLQQILAIAADDNRDVFLPAGTYLVSELKLPLRVRLSGVAGATRLVFGGGDFMLQGERCERVSLTNLVIDGAGRDLAEFVPGLVHLAECGDVAITNCAISGSSRAGVALDRCEGSISRSSFSEIGEVAIRAVESRGLSISDNTIAGCGAGGILVQRWTEGEDGTIVTGNRISTIADRDSQDGPNGCGVSVFRANGVMVSGNQIADCVASGIKVVAAADVQVSANRCRASGGAGIRAVGGFAGLTIAHNVVTGATVGIDLDSVSESRDRAVVTGNNVRDVTTSAGAFPARGAQRNRSG